MSFDSLTPVESTVPIDSTVVSSRCVKKLFLSSCDLYNKLQRSEDQHCFKCFHRTAPKEVMLCGVSALPHSPLRKEKLSFGDMAVGYCESWFIVRFDF